MLTFDDATLQAWLGAWLWPFLRILALLGTMPVLQQRAVPVRVKVALSFLVTVAAQTAMPPVPSIPLDSAAAALTAAQQVILGSCMGFAVRIVFAGVELAGELIGLQMGLNFAGFFDPAAGGQTTAVSRFYGVCVSWIFLASGGHLILIAAVIQSFQVFPIGPEPLAFIRMSQPHQWGAEIFRIALWISLPLISMLMFTNLAMGILSRIAPQLNLFAIGFPITLSVGLMGVMMTLPMLDAPFQHALERMLSMFSP